MKAPASTLAAATLAPVPDALRNFDTLPEAANVRLPVVAALFACSPATVWRRVKSQSLPAPRKLSEGVTAWKVGELRKALNGEAWQ
jgi:predicted DNA-binding transcriptional regulator AlpA